MSTHENWFSFDLEFSIVAVHDIIKLENPQNFTRVNEKFSKKWNIIGTCNIADVGIV